MPGWYVRTHAISILPLSVLENFDLASYSFVLTALIILTVSNYSLTVSRLSELPQR